MSVISKLKVWIGSDTSDLQKGLKKSKKEVSAFGTGIKKLKGMIAGAFAVSSIVSFAKECLGLNKVQAEAEKKLGAVIKATGAAAGLTADEMKKYASQLQDVTKYGDEVTIDAMAIMSTFKSIKGDVFKEAIASAQDMATVLNTDLNAAVMQIGKALESPEIGLTALRRSGVSFSQEQVKQIKQLVAEGKKQEAQLIMLKELQNEFGGAAKAAAGDAYGAATQLSNAWGDLKEVIGAAVTPSVESINSLTNATTEVTNVLNDESIPVWRKWLGMLSPTLSRANKLLAEQNRMIREDNEEIIKGLKLSELSLNDLLGIQNVYKTLNKERGDNRYQQTLKAISDEIDKRASGVKAETEAQKKAREAAEERARLEEKKRQAIQDTIDMEEKTSGAIGEKIKALQNLKSATDITDQASLDYYNKEIARLNLLIQKTDELSRKRVLDAQKKMEGGPISQPAVLYGLDDALFDINGELPVFDDLAQLPDKLEPVRTKLQEIQKDCIDVSDVVNAAFNDLAVGFGENIGELIAGSGDLQGFATLVAGTFADMAINVGKTAISTGIAVKGIQLALKSLNWAAAIAAGVALVALGTAVKSSLGKIADGGNASGTFSGNAYSNEVNIGNTKDYSSGMDSGKINVIVSGELKAKGSNLVAAINSENIRKGLTT